MESLETSEGEKKLWGLRTILPCISEDVGFRGEVCMCWGRWGSGYDSWIAYSKGLICFLKHYFPLGLKIMMQQWHHLLAPLSSHYSASELALDVCWVSLWCCPTLNSLVKCISFVALTQL